MSKVFQRIFSWLCPEWQPRVEQPGPKSWVRCWGHTSCSYGRFSLHVGGGTTEVSVYPRAAIWLCTVTGWGNGSMSTTCLFGHNQENSGLTIEGVRRGGFFSHKIIHLQYLYCCPGVLGGVMCLTVLLLALPCCLDPTVDTPGCTASGQGLIAGVCQMVVGWGSTKGKINLNISSGQCRNIPTAKILKWRNNIPEADFSPLFLLFSFLVFTFCYIL